MTSTNESNLVNSAFLFAEEAAAFAAGEDIYHEIDNSVHGRRLL